MSRLEVRTLAREEFLAAVTGNPESVERAEEVVSTRLQAGLPGVLDLTRAASGHPGWAYGQGRFTIMPSWAAKTWTGAAACWATRASIWASVRHGSW